jgi:hypothetical protein
MSGISSGGSPFSMRMEEISCKTTGVRGSLEDVVKGRWSCVSSGVGRPMKYERMD